MRFVTVKSVAQQDLLALHRVRAQLVKSRTALCNQLRGLLRERGVVVRVGVAGLKRGLPAALADESSELCGELRELLGEMGQWLRILEQRIASCEAQITRKFKHDERCARFGRGAGCGPADRHRVGGRSGQCAALQERTRVKRISGAGFSPAFIGRQDRAARDYQAW
jgi:transposase